MRLLLSGESDRMKLLVRERSELTAELEAAPAAENVVALHPATLAGYEQQLARFQEAPGKGVREGDSMRTPRFSAAGLCAENLQKSRWWRRWKR
jgi:hypothetical protein